MLKLGIILTAATVTILVVEFFRARLRTAGTIPLWCDDRKWMDACPLPKARPISCSECRRLPTTP